MDESALATVVSALEDLRVPAVVDEPELHDAIARCLGAAGIGHRHEVVLGPRCRIDFLTSSGCGIEVKRGGTWAAKVQEQLERYLAFDEVACLVLVTERRCDLYLPDDLSSRVEVVVTSKLWGIAT